MRISVLGLEGEVEGHSASLSHHDPETTPTSLNAKIRFEADSLSGTVEEAGVSTKIRGFKFGKFSEPNKI